MHASTTSELLTALTVTNTTSNTSVYVAEKSICNNTGLALLKTQKGWNK
jgi:hypothetical protein